MRLLPTIAGPSDLKKLSPEQLPELAAEIRHAICDAVSKTGGHLAPNLGVVELTIALHYVFDFGADRLLFDVGHQCYPHKLLTGRLPLLSRLRTREGMAGFPEPRESPFDLFSVGHAGTGISTAVGMARGDQLSGQAFDPRTNPSGRRVVTLIGDASIVNGVAMEGLNNAGTLKRQFLVVLNDNGMSIAHPQGAIAQYFDRVRMSHLYADFKKGAAEILRQIPGGSLLHDAYHKAGEAAKAVLSDNRGGGWFEHFGLVNVGPIDGHDLPTLIEFLTEARDFERPMVLHVKTIKGKGVEFAERDASRFHSPPAFNVHMADAAEDAPQAAVPSTQVSLQGCRVELKTEGPGLTRALQEFPQRAWDTGICESHAMDMMAGLAKTGFRPFFAVYSTFLQRAFDQAFQEVALQGLPVRLCLDRAGLVGGDGAVHHGFCDISLLRTLPEAALLAAIDEPSLIAALEFMRTYDAGLSAVRYPRDIVSPRLAAQSCPPFAMGKARCLTSRFADGRETPDIVILAFGTPAITALEAADQLSDEYKIAVYDARFAKPVDTVLLRSLLQRRIPILTIEDHGLIGGFGAAILEAAQELALDASRITRLALPDAWIHQDSRAKQLAEVGLDAPGIVRSIRAAVTGAVETGNAREPRPTVPAL